MTRTASPAWVAISVWLLAFGLMSSGCKPAGPWQWKSQHHPVALTLPAGWKRISPQKDGREESVVGFRNPSTGSMCLVKVSPDVPSEVISTRMLLDAHHENVLAADPQAMLVEEKEVEAFGHDCVKMEYLLTNQNTGKRNRVFYFTRRTGEWCVQFQYGYQDDGETSDPPAEIAALLGTVELFPDAKNQ